MVTSHNFGHQIYYKNGWKYLDNDQLIESEKRKCPCCNQFQTENGHDPCIANLPGIKSACCGHGTKNKGKKIGKDQREILAYLYGWGVLKK
ncbi:MAG TPA: hypothetical protein ENI23_16680 [bacterium]|nr:hypothetical protein [bacterium]